MDYRTTSAHKFRIQTTWCYFNKRTISAKKIICSFEVLSYRIGLYFHEYKLAIEIDKNGHIDRDIDYEIKRQEAIEQELGCKAIRIDTDKEDFDILKAVN